MLIGLHGKARSGKDQSYRYIAEWAEDRGLSVCRDAFADRLKVSAARALGFTGTLDEVLALWERMKEPGWEIVVREPLRNAVEHSLTIREFTQLYGDEGHRQVFGSDFWVEALFAAYPPESDDLLVITDVRYVNEAQAVHRRGGEIWHVLRGRNVGSDPHTSEQLLPTRYIDHLILNDRDLPHLRGLLRMRMNLWTQSHK